MFHINFDKQEINISYNGTNQGNEKTIIVGGTAPRYTFDVASGYEKLENQILDLDTLNTKSSVLYSKAYYINDTVFGICNVYNDTVGYLSGGGNYAEEEINHSIYYRYNKNTDTLIEIKRIEQGMIVAFSQNKIIYW